MMAQNQRFSRGLRKPKLKPIWRDDKISWIKSEAELEKIMRVFEIRRYRRLLNISYKDHVTNEEIRRKIKIAIGENDELLMET